MRSGHHQFELEANCSLSAAGCVLAFVIVAAASLGVAMVCVLQGYWPVLPFAGLELAFLAWALRATWRNGQSRERLVIDADDITIERWPASAPSPSIQRLPRTWTKTAMLPNRGRPGGAQLALGQRGRWWIIGAFLPEPEKRSLKRRIDQILRQSPDAAVADR